MLSRKQHDVEGISLPDEWTNEFTGLLNSIYKDECNRANKSFYILGFTYPNEVLLAISFMDDQDMNALPVTLIISADLKEGQKAKKLLDTLIDSVGVFFDSHFGNTEGNDYNTSWSNETFRNIEIFYQVSRENILLTLKADELLK
ncbi:MAG: hypothetical protein DRQ88_09880 [Epsilonproteobacteria bacterium]|nr:MAG: hypothetical protein DRQ89_10495 [Campylobacterota bacterium]RLA65007.1 MAG: hypothetical protein DRQ88_09880 [Campylobacterota bacterium]